MNAALLEALLAPISEAYPAGEDLAYSRLFDEIREARRADDLSLSQGEWSTGIKVAEWPKVRQLCEQAFKTQTKDLQLLAWYIEALTRLDGFVGLFFGLQFGTTLLERYWESLYPEFDMNDLDERVGKLEWLNKQLPSVIKEVPLTKVQEGAYSWFAWNDSREVKNMGLRDPEKREAAINEGRLSDERFDRAATSSGLSFYQQINQDLDQARAAFDQFDSILDSKMGRDAPGTSDIRNALIACKEVVKSLFTQLGGYAGEAVAEAIVVNKETPQQSSSAPVSGVVGSNGPIQNRADAVRSLHDVAKYFRQNEPHSPIALLVERAARWADMPLEAWLASVIKDNGTLAQLRDLLDIRSE